MARMGAVIVALSLILAACGRREETPAAGAAPPTLDAQQQAVYQRTCATCHERPGTGAPPAGDRQAWAARVDQGLSALVDHAINGYGGMPPMGLCMECDQDQLIAFIEYMAGVECDDDQAAAGE